jgi:hypothetical protein
MPREVLDFVTAVSHAACTVQRFAGQKGIWDEQAQAQQKQVLFGMTH